MDEPYYYRSAEDVVPRDAVYVIVCSSVRVVPPGAFEGCEHLKRVGFQEGVEAICAEAFATCLNLERVDWASSIRTIGDGAFHDCWSLSEVVLPEGLEAIGVAAFCGCALERITVPSSIVEMGKEAFAYCWRLSEVNLTEGLIRIGAEAFYCCNSLRRIAIPTSVMEIGEEAFADCDDLESVTLAGGMVMVAREAFARSRKLRNIATPSEAIVIEDGEYGNGRAAVKTGGTIVRDPDRRDDNGHRAREPTRLILASPYLAVMKSEDVGRAKDAINQITGGHPPGEGPLDAGGRLPWESPLDNDEDGDSDDRWDVYTIDEWIRVCRGADRIRARFRGLLSAHRRAIASILERAIEPDVARIITSFLPDVEGR